MRNNNSLKWFATSFFALAVVVILAVGIEAVEGMETSESDELSQCVLSEIDVFKDLSFVDVSEESSFLDVLSKNDDSNGNLSEYHSENDVSENGSSEFVSAEDSSEISEESAASDGVDTSSSEDSSEGMSESLGDVSKNSSVENSIDSSKENSENASEESSVTEEPSCESSKESSEESSEEVSKDPSAFPTDVDLIEGEREPFVFFQQDSPKWKDMPYGTNKIGSHGCGPVNMAMVISTITGKVIYPDQAAKWSVDNGYWSKNVGTAHALMTAMAKAYGVPVTTLPQTSWTEAMNALKEGKYIITRVKSGMFATNNHFLTIRGITEDGKLLIANSISYEDSVKEWSQSTIKGQINYGFWVYG